MSQRAYDRDLAANDLPDPDPKPATDAEIVQYKLDIEFGPGLSEMDELALLARIEADAKVIEAEKEARRLLIDTSYGLKMGMTRKGLRHDIETYLAALDSPEEGT